MRTTAHAHSAHPACAPVPVPVPAADLNTACQTLVFGSPSAVSSSSSTSRMGACNSWRQWSSGSGSSGRFHMRSKTSAAACAAPSGRTQRRRRGDRSARPLMLLPSQSPYCVDRLHAFSRHQHSTAQDSSRHVDCTAAWRRGGRMDGSAATALPPAARSTVCPPSFSPDTRPSAHGDADTACRPS